MLDPVEKPRILFMHGSGGDGKSATINTILSNLKGVCSSLSKDYVGSHTSMSVSDLDKVVMSRIVTYGDVTLKNGSINNQFWKLLTGGDVVNLPTGEGKLNCTGIFASNNLWMIPSWGTKTWFTRRSIVLSMKRVAKGLAPPPETYTEVECLRFVSNCIRSRIQFDYPPLDLRTVFLTMFGYGISQSTRGVKEDPDCSPFESISATWAVSLSSMVAYDRLVEAIESMYAYLIGEFIDIKYIRGFTLEY